jgi:hypothetical protein
MGVKTKGSIQKGGIYKLVIELSKDKEIKVGRLGTFVFPKGFYISREALKVVLIKG